MTKTGWPDFEIPGPGQFAMRAFAGGNPAAGAEDSKTVPAGERWRLIQVYDRLVTSAAVANRRVALQLDTVDAFIVELYADRVQAASISRFNYWTRGAGAVWFEGTNTPERLMLPLPDVLMVSGTTIRTFTQNIQAGDQWGGFVIVYEQIAFT